MVDPRKKRRLLAILAGSDPMLSSSVVEFSAPKPCRLGPWQGRQRSCPEPSAGEKRPALSSEAQLPRTVEIIWK